MSGDRVVEPREGDDMYRIETDAGVLMGTEYGGIALGFESRTEAQEMVERRAELAEERRQFLSTLGPW